MIKKVIFGSLLVGTSVGAGMFIQKYIDLKNTPEAIITKLEVVKSESKAAEEKAKEAKKKYDESYKKLVSTEAQFKKEVHDEIEAEVRKELADYISGADEKYAKAAKENELATLKLELAKKSADSFTINI